MRRDDLHGGALVRINVAVDDVFGREGGVAFNLGMDDTANGDRLIVVTLVNEMPVVVALYSDEVELL